MKANEVPEKIYVNFHFIETHPGSSPLVTKQGINKHDVVYTRTDAFIEKACSWFRTLDDKEPPYTTTEEFIKGFKKAMKL